MKRTMSNTMKLLKGRFVFDLFAKLYKKKVGTNAVESHCKRVCEDLPRGRQRTLLQRFMKWKHQDARSKLNEARRENTRIWREEKRVLRTWGVLDTYLTVWRREKQRCQTELNNKLRSKINTLIRRHSNQEVIQESVRNVFVGDLPITEDFSTGPRSYGSVLLNMDKQDVLSLPPKYAVYSTVNLTDCEAQVERVLQSYVGQFSVKAWRS